MTDTYEPTTVPIPLPSEIELVELIAEGIKKGIRELRSEIIEMMVEAQSIVDTQHEGEKEPDIQYARRFHGFKVVTQLAAPVAAFVVLTGVYVYFAGNLAAALIGILVVSSAVVFGAWVIDKRQALIDDDRERKNFKRWARLALVIASLALCVAFVFVEESLGVSYYWSAVYLALSLPLLYFSLRIYYMWSHMRIVRDGGMLRVERPEKGIFFLPTLNRKLFLRNVNDSTNAQTWIEEKLGMHRIHIRLDAEMPDPKESAEAKFAYKNAKFWTDLKFVADGEQLNAAIQQGILNRKG